jgi:hypothetical protein
LRDRASLFLPVPSHPDVRNASDHPDQQPELIVYLLG